MAMKRVAAAILWIYSCWAAGGLGEYVFGTSALLGLAVGVGGAIFFGVDPLRIVWPRPAKEKLSTEQLTHRDAGSAVASAVAR